MSNTKNILKGSIIIIAISFVISLLSIYKIKLDRPVFLKNYKEVEVTEDNNIYSMGTSTIELKYISNREDKRVVQSIIFKEAPELNFDASEQPYDGSMIFYNNSNRTAIDYGRYSIHTIYLNLNSSNDKYDLSKDIILEEATIFFNDGLTMDVDLGKIILYQKHNIKTPLNWSGTSILSDVSSKSLFDVDEYIEILKVDSSLFEYSKDLFDFNIGKSDNMDSINTIYNENEQLVFISQFHNINDIERKLYSYDIKPIIYFKDKNGQEFKERVYRNSYNPNFNFIDIYKYLRSKGEI